jgi:hypothetical protein
VTATLDKIFARVSEHKDAALFQRPVPKAAAPDYDTFIYRRMDLSAIRTRLRSGVRVCLSLWLAFGW